MTLNNMHKTMFIAFILLCFPFICHAKLYCPTAEDWKPRQKDGPWLLKTSPKNLEWRVVSSDTSSSITEMSLDMLVVAEIDEYFLGHSKDNYKYDVYCTYTKDGREVVKLTSHKSTPNIASRSTSFVLNEGWFRYSSYKCNTDPTVKGNANPCTWEWK